MNRRSVAVEFHRVALRLLRRLRKEDEAFDISTARLSALSVLVFVGPQTVGSLAQIEQVSQPTMTKLAQGLARQGLIRIEKDLSDGRARQLSATSKGEKLLERARRRRIEVLSTMMAKLSDAQVRTLKRAANLVDVILEEK